MDMVEYKDMSSILMQINSNNNNSHTISSKFIQVVTILLNNSSSMQPLRALTINNEFMFKKKLTENNLSLRKLTYQFIYNYFCIL